MAKKEKITAPVSNKINSRIFPNTDGIYERFHCLRKNDPYKDKRQKYLLNYQRRNWKRGGTGPEANRQDPNFGQFKSKIDAAMGTFTQVLTDRAMTVKIVPRYAPKDKIISLSDSISSAFHRYFIKPWEDRYLIEIASVREMIFEGKAIEHWPTPGCVYSESVPVEKVFPDSNAGPDVRKWNYVFIEKDHTICELQDMLEENKESDKEMDDDKMPIIKFKTKYLKEIIDNAEQYRRLPDSGSASGKRREGEISNGNKDFLIPIVYAYVKDNPKKPNKVSLYCFPAEYAKKEDAPADDVVDIKLLYERNEYCECITNVVGNRAYQITSNWWTCDSFAEQIYLSCVLYDKSMSLVIRAAKRNMILYFKSDNPGTVQKLLKQTDDEVQHIASDVQYIQTGQNNNVREVIEITRQVMIDTENGQNLAQAPGSQNVKGYAITAQEAQIRTQERGESETLNIKVLMSNDVALWKEIYRRAIDVNISPDFKKAHKAFTDELKALNIDPEFYDFKNVYFTPSFINGGSQMSRVANAQGVAGALAIDPKNPGQQQAQRDLIGAFVGIDNVDNYVAEAMGINPVVLKAGGENEDLDNPNLNPNNVPVLPDDLHLQEIPIHLQDYELKLTTAENIIKAADGTSNIVKKMILLMTASELIVAQDNKGGHINAHLQQVEPSKINKMTLDQLIPRYQAAQSKQDQMSAGIQKVLDELDTQMEQNSLDGIKERHAANMYKMEEDHLKATNDVALDKALQQRQASIDRTADKREADLAKTGLDLAKQEHKTSIELTAQEQKLQHEQAKQATVKPSAT